MTLGFSFCIFLFSFFFSVWLQNGVGRQQDRYSILGPIPKIDPPVIYRYSLDTLDTIKQAFRSDGVVAVRGLIPQELLDRLDEASQVIVQDQLNVKRRDKRKRSGTQFFTTNHGVVFLHPPQLEHGSNVTNEPNLSPFLEVAVDSTVPEIVAALLYSSCCSGSETCSAGVHNLRLIRDIFLAKDDDPHVCGWHVDDFGFWPATPNSTGINAWIALDS